MIASGHTVDVFANRPRLLRGTLLVMFAAAIAIRLMQLDRPGVLVDRDYTSAMFARTWFFENRSDQDARPGASGSPRESAPR